MGKSVFEIESWPHTHIDEWRQFYQLRPFGSWRDNYHAAQIADVLARVNGNKIPFADWFYKDAETADEERKARDLKAFEDVAAMVKAKVKDG